MRRREAMIRLLITVDLPRSVRQPKPAAACAASDRTRFPARGKRANAAPNDAAPTDPSRPARGREHPHHARGGRRGRAAGDALFDRQGQRGDAAPGDEGLLPGAAAVPAAARRHDLEVPGHVRVARQGRAPSPAIELLVYKNPEAEAQGINPFDHGPLHTDMWKTEGLKQALDKYGFDAAFGGARRDEEKSRAKERVFSFRDAQPPLGPEAPAARAVVALQRRARTRARASASSRCRTGPSSTSGNTSMREKIPIVPLYFARRAADGRARRR